MSEDIDDETLKVLNRIKAYVGSQLDLFDSHERTRNGLDIAPQKLMEMLFIPEKAKVISDKMDESNAANLAIKMEICESMMSLVASNINGSRVWGVDNKMMVIRRRDLIRATREMLYRIIDTHFPEEEE